MAGGRMTLVGKGHKQSVKPVNVHIVKGKRSLASKVPSKMPKKMRVKLPYTAQISMGNGTLTAEKYIFRMNSLLDPDLTDTGNQPAGFDEYAALYECYKVLNSSIEVTWYAPINSATSGAMVLTVAPTTDPSPTNRNAAGVLVLNRVKHAFCGPSDGSHGIKTVRNKGAPYTVLGLKKDVLELSALNAANPAQQAYWWINLAIADASTAVITTDLIVKVVYDVEFTDRIDLSLS